MVVFTCQHCGDPVKKPAVEKHYNTKCRNRGPHLTCVDCLKDFGNDFVGHNQCMTEEQRYSAQGTVFKAQKGKKKQEQYIEIIHEILNSNELPLSVVQRKLLDVCSNHENVPRKLERFQNFMKNVARHVTGRWTDKDLQYIFNIIEDAWKKKPELDKSKPTSQAEEFKGKEMTGVEETKKNEDANNKSKKKKHCDQTLSSGDKLGTEQKDEETDKYINGEFSNDIPNVKQKKSKKEKQRTKSLSEGYVDQANAISPNGNSKGVNGDSHINEINKRKKEKSKRKSVYSDCENGNDEEEKYVNGFDENQIDLKDTNSGEIKENMDKITKKQLKKKKRYEKYLEECNNVAKSEVKENVINSEVDESEVNIGSKKSKKKNKKMKTNDCESMEPLGPNGDINVENVSDSKEDKKKNKKRKLEEDVGEIPEKRTKETCEEGEGDTAVGAFNWGEVISRVLQSRPDKELSLKKLGKKVVNEYQTVRQDHRTYEELLAKFNKKVNKTKGVRVLRDRAKLIE